MLNISQVPKKLYLVECLFKQVVNSMNQGIGTSIPENWRKRGGGGAHDVSYQGGRAAGVEIFKAG